MYFIFGQAFEANARLIEVAFPVVCMSLTRVCCAQKANFFQQSIRPDRPGRLTFCRKRWRKYLEYFLSGCCVEGSIKSGDFVPICDCIWKTLEVKAKNEHNVLCGMQIAIFAALKP